MRTSRNGLVLALLLLPAGVLRVAAQAPAAALVAGAVAAAPDSLRAGATVLGWEGETTRVVRQGSNGLICLADKPGDKGFQSACYTESLEPFMARGRELRAQHKTREQVDSARLADIEAKRLVFPANATVVYNLAGSLDSLDADGVPRHPTRWYVVYTQYQTPETTGIPVLPDGTGRPWMMFPGKPWAHLMITPK